MLCRATSCLYPEVCWSGYYYSICNSITCLIIHFRKRREVERVERGLLWISDSLDCWSLYLGQASWSRRFMRMLVAIAICCLWSSRFYVITSTPWRQGCAIMGLWIPKWFVRKWWWFVSWVGCMYAASWVSREHSCSWETDTHRGFPMSNCENELPKSLVTYAQGSLDQPTDFFLCFVTRKNKVCNLANYWSPKSQKVSS